MNTLLVILAHPHTEQQSFSMRVYESFLEKYKQLHPNDKIIIRDLYNDDIPIMDDMTFQAMAKIQTQKELSEAEKIRLKTRENWLDEFISADKYVFVNPMYNHFLPAELKSYIDITSVARKTFRYTEKGAEGLLNNKKVLHIQAAGGKYHDDGVHGEFQKDFGSPYLEMMLNYYGIRDVQHVYIEGVAMDPENSQTILENAIMESEIIANNF